MENISRHNTTSGHKGNAPKRGALRHAGNGSEKEAKMEMETETGAERGAEAGGRGRKYKKVPDAMRPGQGFGNLHS